MRIIRTLLVSAFVLLTSVEVMAQKDFLLEANTAFAHERYYDAIELYKKAYTRVQEKEQKSFIIFRTAESYRFTGNSKQAEVWYAKAIKASYKDPIAIYYLAEMKKINGKLEDAAEEYQNYVNKKPNDKKGKDGLRSVELAMDYMKNPTRYEVEVAPIINSEEDDYSPNFADNKNNVLYFTSTREAATGSHIHEGSGQGMEDIFQTTRDRKGKWSEPIPLNETVNSEASEGTICMNKRRNTLYFTRCGFDKKEGNFGCSIYWAKKQGKIWGDAEVIPLADDTLRVGHPAITNDDKVLLFSSNMPGGYGGKDIWYVLNKGRGVWSEPINLGSSINTAGDEMYPYIAFDNKLYFASNGHIGMGGLDIFSAEQTGDNQWGNVQNMGYPINSTSHDFGIVWDGDKNRGYLSSEREGDETMGGTDIWEFYWPPLVFALEGIALDKETNEPIPNATVKLVGTDGTNAEVTTDAKGEFKFGKKGTNDFYIKENQSYELTVGAVDYLVAKGNETTVAEPESKVFYHEYKLQPVAEPIVLPEVLFELGKWDLLPESKDSLDYLYNILVDNETIIIELSAHTDSRDTDAKNLKLSQNRANSCVEYLVSKGIPSGRMKPVGYGERRLKISDAEIAKLSTKQEKEDAHQKNRRVEFEVLNFDWVPQ